MVRERLGLPESGFTPILIPLRNLGAYLKAHHFAEDGTEGYGRLLDFLRAYLQGERITVPDDFFDADLEAGRVVLLFDGMDEVGDFDLRRRVARLIEAFAGAYALCRIVVTSRIVGYTGAARLGDDFATTTIRDFTLSDVEQFLTHWHRLVAIGQMGPGEAAEHFAAAQTHHLLEAIRDNPRVRELAINPLMLTVIALVHRDRVKLPERRAELYAEAVDVLLGKWDEARGVEDTRILDDRPFDVTDRRLLLQSIALAMHAAGQKDLAVDDLCQRLRTAFASKTADRSRRSARLVHLDVGFRVVVRP
jgi:predicted NACHT family NTPase